MVPALKQERMNMKKHEKEAMKAMNDELREWLSNRTVRVCPWTMGSSILGVVAYVDLLEFLPEEPQILWRVQLREERDALVLETLVMGTGDEEYWRAVGKQGQAQRPEVIEAVRFAKEVA